MGGNIGGRKVVATLLVLGIGTAIALYRGDVPGNLMQLLEVVFGAFVAGNGIEHMARAHRDVGCSRTTAPDSETPESSQSVDLGPVLQAVAETKAAVEATHAPIAGTQQTVSALLQYVTNIRK